MINKYPYTDFHELNLDWFLRQFKALKDDWTALAADNAEFKQTLTESFDTLDHTVQTFTDFVTNYFDNLDVQQEINNKLDEMVSDGTLATLLTPFVNTLIPDTVTAWLNDNVNPVGSAVTIDRTLSVAGSAADAKVTGEIRTGLDATFPSLTWSPTLILGQYIKADGSGTGSSNKYARTDLYNGYPARIAVVLSDPTYKMRLAYYNANGDITDQSTYLGRDEYHYGTHYIPSTVPRFAVSFMRTDEATFTATDQTNVAAALSAYAATDKTLSIESMAADALKTGSLISDLNAEAFFEYTDNSYHSITIGQVPNWNTGIPYAATGYTITGRLFTQLQTVITAQSGYKVRIAYHNGSTGNYGDTYTGYSGAWSDSVTLTPDITPYYQIAVRSDNSQNPPSGTTVYDLVTITNRFDRNKQKPLKIFGIGNSYLWHVFKYLSEIMHRAGIYPAITGQCYKGAIKLADQYANRTSTTYYNYYRKYNNYYNGLNCRDTTGVALDTALEDEDWDWIIFQQQSDESGQYASFVSGGFDINTFVSYVKTKCPNAKIAIVAPWTHANGFTGSDFMTYYGGSVAAQDAAIKTTIPQVADHMSQCDLIIDLNRLVDVARQNSYLGALGTEMLMSDKNHIDPGIPTYMCGIYMAMCLGADAGSVFWYPTISEDPNITSATNSFLAWLARQCAKNTFNSFDV